MDDMEEYKFSDTSGAAPVKEEMQSPPLSEFKSKLKVGLKKFLVPILLSVAIIVAYKGMSFYNARKNSQYEQQKEQFQQQTNRIAQPASQPAPQSVVQLPAQPVQPVQVVQEIDNDQINAVQQKLSNMEKSVQDEQSQLSKTQQDIATVNQNIEILASSMQQILTEVQKLKDPKVESKKKRVRPKKDKPMVYHIRAIVSERVWVDSDNGKKSYTLRVGDKLDDYGTVEVISPQEGLVLMSDGSYIQYGSNDI